MKHKCPIDGCTRMLNREYLMCGPHWHMLPKDLQGRVYALWGLAVAQVLWARGVLPDHSDERQKAKREKLATYMAYARLCGTLEMEAEHAKG